MKESDNFCDIQFTREKLDLYIIRSSIFKAIQKNKQFFNGVMLDVGCGKMPYKNFLLKNSAIVSYVGLDIEQAIVYDSNIKADFSWDGVTMPFADCQYDCAFATEVLEHCPDPSLILSESHRVLKPGGVIFFTVPFLWPLHEVPHDEYRYTPFSLERHLKNAGFVNIKLEATGGWHASLAQMLGLWVRRATMSKTKKRLFSFILKPIISILIKKDKFQTVNFTESQMITGLSGIAYKK